MRSEISRNVTPTLIMSSKNMSRSCVSGYKRNLPAKVLAAIAGRQEKTVSFSVNAESVELQKSTDALQQVKDLFGVVGSEVVSFATPVVSTETTESTLSTSSLDVCDTHPMSIDCEAFCCLKEVKFGECDCDDRIHKTWLYDSSCDGCSSSSDSFQCQMIVNNLIDRLVIEEDEVMTSNQLPPFDAEGYVYKPDGVEDSRLVVSDTTIVTVLDSGVSFSEGTDQGWSDHSFKDIPLYSDVSINVDDVYLYRREKLSVAYLKNKMNRRFEAQMRTQRDLRRQPVPVEVPKDFRTIYSEEVRNGLEVIPPNNNRKTRVKRLNDKFSEGFSVRGVHFLKNPQPSVDQEKLFRENWQFQSRREFSLEEVKLGFYNVHKVLDSLFYLNSSIAFEISDKNLWYFFVKETKLYRINTKRSDQVMVLEPRSNEAMYYWLKYYKTYFKVFCCGNDTMIRRLDSMYNKKVDEYYKIQSVSVAALKPVHKKNKVERALDENPNLMYKVADRNNRKNLEFEAQMFSPSEMIQTIQDSAVKKISDGAWSVVTSFLHDIPNKILEAGASTLSNGVQQIKSFAKMLRGVFDSLKVIVKDLLNALFECVNSTLLIAFAMFFFLFVLFKYRDSLKSMASYVTYCIPFLTEEENGGKHIDVSVELKQIMNPSQFRTESGIATIVPIAGAIISCVFATMDKSYLLTSNTIVNFCSRLPMAYDSMEDSLCACMDFIYMKIFSSNGEHLFSDRNEYDKCTSLFNEWLAFSNVNGDLRSLVRKSLVKAAELKVVYTKALEVERYMSVMKFPQSFANRMNKMIIDIKELQKIAEIEADFYKTRIETPLLWLYGKPGQGKTTVYPHIIAAVYQKLQKFDKTSGSPFREDFHLGMIHNRSKESVFWEGYDKHFVTVWNEAFAGTDAKERSRIAQEILTACEDGTFPLNMAFDAKGKAFFSSYLAVITSNISEQDLLARMALTDPSALIRRRTLYLEVVRDEKFVHVTNDQGQVVQANFDDAWQFILRYPEQTEFQSAFDLGTPTKWRLAAKKEKVVEMRFSEVVSCIYEEIVSRMQARYEKANLMSSFNYVDMVDSFKSSRDSKGNVLKDLDEIVVRPKIYKEKPLPPVPKGDPTVSCSEFEAQMYYMKRVCSWLSEDGTFDPLGVVGAVGDVAEKLKDSYDDKVDNFTGTMKGRVEATKEVVNEKVVKPASRFLKGLRGIEEENMQDRWFQSRSAIMRENKLNPVYFDISNISKEKLSYPANAFLYYCIRSSCAIVKERLDVLPRLHKVLIILCSLQSYPDGFIRVDGESVVFKKNIVKQIEKLVSIFGVVELPWVEEFIDNMKSCLKQIRKVIKEYSELFLNSPVRYCVESLYYHFVDASKAQWKCVIEIENNKFYYNFLYNTPQTLKTSGTWKDCKKSFKSKTFVEVRDYYSEGLAARGAFIDMIYKCQKIPQLLLNPKMLLVVGGILASIIGIVCAATASYGKDPVATYSVEIEDERIARNTIGNRYFQSHVSKCLVGKQGGCNICSRCEAYPEITLQEFNEGKVNYTKVSSRSVHTVESKNRGNQEQMHRPRYRVHGGDVKLMRKHIKYCRTQSCSKCIRYDERLNRYETESVHRGEHSKHHKPKYSVQGFVTEGNTDTQYVRVALNIRTLRFICGTMENPIAVETYGLFSSRRAFSAGHVYSAVKESLRLVHIMNGESIQHTFYPDQLVFKNLEHGRDLMCIDFPPTMNEFPSLGNKLFEKSRFPTAASLLHPKIVRLHRTVHKGIVNISEKGRNGAIKAQKDITSASNTQNYFLSGAYIMQSVPSEAGDCGLPYVMLDSTGVVRILGLHVGAVGTTASSDAYFSPLYDDDYKGSNFFTQGVYIPEWLQFVPYNGRETYDGQIQWMGTLKRPKILPKESNIVASVAQANGELSDLYEITQYPGILTKCAMERLDGSIVQVEPLKYRMTKLNNAECRPCPRGILNLLLHDMEKLCDGFFPFLLETAQLRRWTLKEVLFGIPGLWPGLPNDTAVGYDMECLIPEAERKNGRKDLWNSDTGYIHPVLIKLVNDLDQAVKDGYSIKNIVAACLKDETRPDPEHPRLFYVGSLSVLCYTVMIMGSLVMLSKGHRSQTQVSIGTSPHSFDWKQMCRDLQSLPDSLFGGGDISGQDMSERSWWGYLLGVTCARKYGYPLNSFEYRCVFEVCRATVAPILVVGDQAYWMDYLNSSGNWLTGFLNSFVSVVCFNYCVLIVQQETKKEDLKKMSKRELTRGRFYGDDNFWSWPKKYAEDFNMVVLARMSFQLFGIKYTTPEKTEVVIPFTEFAELEFLKRRFRVVENDVFAPLCEDSIHNMIMWTKLPTDPETGEKLKSQLALEHQWLTNVETACQEWFHYGRERFEVESGILAERCFALKLPFPGKPYEHYYQSWISGYH